MDRYTLKSFYSFTPQEEVQLLQLKDKLERMATELDVLGLVILSKEGFNATLAARDVKALDLFIERLKSVLQTVKNSLIKVSFSEKRPFRRFEIKVRPEIVTFDRESYVPDGKHCHLSPEEWNTYLAREGVVVIDTRNDYETKIGKFKKAIDLDLKEFTDLPEKIRHLDTDREKPHLIYCTGGIRCEKAIYELEAQGFKNVYQLEGGILNYLEHYPNREFAGECFVFGSRVAVDQSLAPSKVYSLCPHCGDVSDSDITCLKCDSPAKLCRSCLDKAAMERELETCSKNCRHHYKIRPDKKGPRQKYFYNE